VFSIFESRGSSITAEEAVEAGKKMEKEYDLEQAYLRIDFNIVVGKKSKLNFGKR